MNRPILLAAFLLIVATMAVAHLRGDADPEKVSFDRRQVAELPSTTAFMIRIDGTRNTRDRVTAQRTYIELVTRKADRMTDDDLNQAIVELTAELAQQDQEANDELQTLIESLQQVVDSYPGTPAAKRGEEALKHLRGEDNPMTIEQW
jgi:hypothetical protein